MAYSALLPRLTNATPGWPQSNEKASQWRRGCIWFICELVQTLMSRCWEVAWSYWKQYPQNPQPHVTRTHKTWLLVFVCVTDVISSIIGAKTHVREKKPHVTRTWPAHDLHAENEIIGRSRWPRWPKHVVMWQTRQLKIMCRHVNSVNVFLL